VVVVVAVRVEGDLLQTPLHVFPLLLKRQLF